MTAIMDNFDPLAYLPSPMPYSGSGQNLDYMSATSAMDALDQYSNFDSDPYMSGDDMSFHHSGALPHPAMMKRYPTGFEDPFADGTMSQIENVPQEGSPSSPSIDRDSRYLGFSMPQFPYALLNESFQRSSININAQLHGMFFLAESQWPTSADTAPPPPELTCYRRNLFQITGNITLPRSLRYIFTEEGSRIPIYELELQVSATESVEGNPVKIISVPWKTPVGGENTKPEDKIEREPPTIPLDKMAGSDMESDYTTFPFQWKRLQFRIATANNGRRKELQQHFTLHLKVMASLSTGGKFPIAESQSGAVIVRGRSPRNFASRKDLPLSSSSTSRKHVPSAARNSISQTSAPQPKPSPPQEELPTTLGFDSPQVPVSAPDIHSWQQQQQAASFVDPLSTPFSVSMNPTSAPAFGQPSPDSSAAFNFAFSPTGVLTNSQNDAPVSLHFDSDNESNSPRQHQSSRTSSRPPTSNPSPSMVNKPRSATVGNIHGSGVQDAPKRPRLNSHHMSLTSAPTLNALPTSMGIPTNLMSTSVPKMESRSHFVSSLYSPLGDDKSYEYFPLSIEDWQPPVDAVFRPHVVHHAGPLYSDALSPVGSRSNKRYFSEVA